MNTTLIEIDKTIESILEGIDKDYTDDGGWWETSVGVSFGKGKLTEIKALFADTFEHTLQPALSINNKDVEIEELKELLRISRASEIEAWRYHPELQEENDSLRKELNILRESTDLAYKEACSLATHLFKKHYASDPDYANGTATWGLCSDTAGVLSQIDNMVTGLTRKLDKPAEVTEFATDARSLLVHSLVASKGWLHAYAESFIDDFLECHVK